MKELKLSPVQRQEQLGQTEELRRLKAELKRMTAERDILKKTALDSSHQRQDARADVFNDIDMFYNPKRRHKTSGGVSPVEFENVNPDS